MGSVDAASHNEVRSVSLRIVDAETAAVILSSTFSNSEPGEPYVPLRRIPVVMVSDIAPKLGGPDPGLGGRAGEGAAPTALSSVRPPPGLGVPRSQDPMEPAEIYLFLAALKPGTALRVTTKSNEMLVGVLTSFRSELLWLKQWNGERRFAYLSRIKRVDRVDAPALSP